MTVQESPPPFGRQLARRIRAIRHQQGLSLGAVETKSGGKIKAVVIGSYERGDRQPSPAALERVAEFFGISVQELLFEPAQPAPTLRPLRFDLGAAGRAPGQAEPLRHWLRHIRTVRGDWNGIVLTVRGSDLRTLAVMYDTHPSALLDVFRGWGVLREVPTDLDDDTGDVPIGQDDDEAADA